MGDDWLRDLIVAAAQETAERIFERLPSTGKPYQATVSDVDSDDITFVVDGDEPDHHSKGKCIGKIPVTGDRVYVFYYGGKAFVHGMVGGFA